MSTYDETIRIHEMLEKTLEPIRRIQDQYFEVLEPIRQAQEVLNNRWNQYFSQYQLMNENIIQIVNSVNEMTQAFSVPFQQLTENLLSNLHESFSAINGITSPAYDILNTLSEGITFSPDGVSITEDALQSISEFIDLPSETTEARPETSTKLISFKEFLLDILIPIFAILIPLIQTQHLHRLDALEEERYQLEESEYQERLIQIEEEQLATEQQILTYLEQISNSLEANPGNQQLLEESVNVLQQSLTVSPELEESADPEYEASDVPDIHNVHK